MKRTDWVPSGWPIVTPRLFVEQVEELVAFIQQVFGASGDFHAERPTELRIGDSMLMVSRPIERRVTTAFLYVYVEDVDVVYRRALDHGATALEAPRELPYGDRRGMVEDAWGNVWQIATHGGRFTP
jgi:PhnB protein